MDPIEIAALLSLPAARLKDLEAEDAGEEAEDEETGVV